jgi:DNA-binding GntR family transcriptional regulator
MICYRYQYLSAKIRASIESGEYPNGGLLPTERELALIFGFSRQTVREALRILNEAGLIERKRRVGTTVKEQRNQVAAVTRSMT